MQREATVPAVRTVLLATQLRTSCALKASRAEAPLNERRGQGLRDGAARLLGQHAIIIINRTRCFHRNHRHQTTTCRSIVVSSHGQSCRSVCFGFQLSARVMGGGRLLILGYPRGVDVLYVFLHPARCRRASAARQRARRGKRPVPVPRWKQNARC